jgi:hypothetical protein
MLKPGVTMQLPTLPAACARLLLSAHLVARQHM